MLGCCGPVALHAAALRPAAPPPAGAARWRPRHRRWRPSRPAWCCTPGRAWSRLRRPCPAAGAPTQGRRAGRRRGGWSQAEGERGMRSMHGRCRRCRSEWDVMPAAGAPGSRPPSRGSHRAQRLPLWPPAVDTTGLPQEVPWPRRQPGPAGASPDVFGHIQHHHRHVRLLEHAQHLAPLLLAQQPALVDAGCVGMGPKLRILGSAAHRVDQVNS